MSWAFTAIWPMRERLSWAWGDMEGIVLYGRRDPAPVAQRFYIRRGTVAQPAVELRDFLELLAAPAVDHHEAAVEFRERGHVAPELFKLRYREDVLVPLAPALFHVFQRNVSGHARRHRPHRRGHFFFVRQLAAR